MVTEVTDSPQMNPLWHLPRPVWGQDQRKNFLSALIRENSVTSVTLNRKGMGINKITVTTFLNAW